MSDGRRWMSQTSWSADGGVRSLKRAVRSRAEGLARVLAQVGISANALTLAGLLLNVCAALIVGFVSWPLGGLCYLLFSSLDFLDGAVARVTGTADPFGAFFDSTLDRVAEAAVLIALVYWYAERNEPLWAVVAAVAIVGSFMVSYARARAEGLGYDCEVGWLQRPERIILLGSALILSPLHRWIVPAALLLLVAATIVTTIQRIAHVAREVRTGARRR